MMSKQYIKEEIVDFNYLCLIKIIIILFLINDSAYSQSKSINKIITRKMNVLKLDLNKKEYINDSLSILLTNFSHKPSPEIGQAERGTAHLSLFQDNNYYEIMLSEHGIAGTPRTKDGLSDVERYDSIIWKEYIIHAQ